MTDMPPVDGGDGPDPPTVDVDPGEPVAELAALGVTPGRQFMARVRRRIGRRELAANILDFSTTSPLSLFLEFLAMIFEGLGGRRTGPGGDR